MAGKLSRADAAGVLVLGRAAAVVAEALSPLLLVRLLDKTGVGLISALLLVHATIGMVVAQGLGRSVLYFLADRPAGEKRTLAWRLVRVQLALAAGAAALVALAGRAWPGGGDFEPRWLLLLAGFVLLDLPNGLLPNMLVAEGRARAAAALGVGRSLGRVAAIIGPPAAGGGVTAILWALLAYGAVNLLVSVAWIRALFGGAPAAPSDVGARAILRFGAPLAATDIVAWLNKSLDRYIVMGWMPAARFAEYRAGSWQIPVLTTIPYSLGAVDTPRFVELFKAGRPDEVMRLWRQAIRKVSLIVVPASLAFAAAAEPFIRLAFTPDYAAAIPVFRLYCLVTMMRVVSFGNVVVAAGRPRLILRAALANLLANLVLSVPLFLWLGFVGPALGTVLAVIPGYLAWSWAVARAAGVRVGETFPWRDVGRVVAVALPGALGAWALGRGWPWGDLALLPVQLAIPVLAFAGLGTLTGLVQREDWAFVGRWLRLHALRGR